MSMRHRGRCALRVLIAFASVPFAAIPSAQTLPQEYSALIRSERDVGPLDASLLGERIDYDTGHVEFVATDVDLPGNNALPVAVGRRYIVQTNPSGVIPERSFGDWDIEVRHIEGVVATSVGWTVPGANPNARCSAFSGAPDALVTTPAPNDPSTQVTTTIPWEQYSTGYLVAVPGYGRRELLRRAPNNTAHPSSGSWPIVTNDWWMVGCSPTLATGSPGTGEGFVALAPDGTKYTFNWLALRPYVPLSRPADSNTPVTATLDRSAAWMMATKVEDRFGNWVKYEYDSNAPLHLRQITSSDGRMITLTYLGTTESVQTISDGSHAWSYGYTFNGSYYSLSSVTRPDASKWQISLDTLNHISWSYPNPWVCGAPGSPSAPFTFTGTITHPSGAQGAFTFTITRRGRSGAPPTCYTNSANLAFASIQPGVYDTLALTQKKITGPGLATPLTWSLAYAGCSGSSCAPTVTTTVTDPRGYATRYTFGTGYDDDEGLLLKQESGGSGATYLQADTYQYFPASGQSYPAPLGTATQTRGDTVRLATLRPLKQRITTLQGTTFTYTAANLDAFGFPQSLTRAGSATKAETITYANNAVKWVLGTVQKIVSGGSAELDLVLNAFNVPTSISRFGDVERTLGYNTDGTLQWTKDGDGHATTYSNWYRGVPKNVGYATGESESVTVSNGGTIDSRTDERGSTWIYDHDAMGRLSGIHYPGGDPGTGGSQTFAPTTIAWSTSAAGWQSTRTTDNAQTITKYDALLRPILVNDNNTRYVNTKYEGEGGPVFVSVPSALPNEGGGTTFQHDGLGRIVERNFVGYVTSYTYQSGFVTRISDPNATTYVHYLTHDEPSTAWPITIDGALYTTNIARDAWGRPQTVSRGSLKREWTWGGRFVCAIYSPERGTTVFARDGAGNVTGSADLAGDVGCDYGAMNSSNKIARAYDNRNRLTGVTYPGGTNENIAQTWWPNGLRKTASRGGITRTTNYNRRGLLTYETLAVDGVPYEIDYAYNTRGQPSGLTYPDATSIDYAPDAWGEPTKIASYATGLAYWPNGAVKSFTYGNGIAHSMSENTRQLPQTVVDGAVINTDYGYDGVGNVNAITDHLAAHTDTVAMTYDGANRLQTANAAAMWGNATFGYDDSDNLKSATVGGVQTNFTIDPATNRASAMVVGGVTTPLQYDGQGHLTHKGSQAFTFDRSDLLLGLPGLESYRYDADGRRTVTDVNGGQRISIYDHEGRLLEELEPAPQVGCAQASDRVFCSSFEKPPVGAAQTRYAYLGGHLVGKDDSQGRHYLHTDALGSLLAETDQSQTVTKRFHYLPFGGAYGNPSDGPGYTGAVTDPSGLVYLQARYYDPQLGRFLSSDPVESDPQTGRNFNRYTYAEANPYSKHDPNGRWVCSGTDDDCAAFESGLNMASDAAASAELDDEEQSTLALIVGFYGDKGVDNVNVSFTDAHVVGGTEAPRGDGSFAVGLARQSSAMELARNIVHEGSHGLDDQRRGRDIESRVERKETELSAYMAQAYFQKAEHFANSSHDGWTPFGGISSHNVEAQAENSVNIACGQSRSGSCGP